MDKKDVIDFFDKLAPCWDAVNLQNEEVVSEILSRGGIRKGIKVLDVACGTGVLFPNYAAIGVKVTGIDISSEMVKRAKEKFPEAEVICADVLEYSFEDKFDAIMIYNAFPHFAEPEKLIEKLSALMGKSGRLTVAHGISEEELEKCHSGSAKNVSVSLVKKEVLAEMMSRWFDVDVMISDDRMYMVSGVKR
ncbi:MAG: methyltransferase domain-containing protein [Clostridia bacterium]|nr:methyltransferase domain-containing protein [Clostridia bacterium]